MELNTLQTTVTSNIAESNILVTTKVVDFFVEREVTRRVTALTTAIQELDKADKEILKFKPDQKSLDKDGNAISETYSPAKFEERKKAVDKASKLRKAIERALNENQFGDLFNVTTAS